MNGQLRQPRRGRRAATYLTPLELVECLRAMRTGAAWLRMIGLVLYALEDVLAFEATRLAP